MSPASPPPLPNRWGVFTPTPRVFLRKALLSHDWCLLSFFNSTPQGHLHLSKDIVPFMQRSGRAVCPVIFQWSPYTSLGTFLITAEIMPTDSQQLPNLWDPCLTSCCWCFHCPRDVPHPQTGMAVPWDMPRPCWSSLARGGD